MKTSEEPYVRERHTASYPVRKAASVRPLLTFFAVLGLIIIGAIAGGLLPRMRREQALAATEHTETTARLVVEVAAAKLESPKSTLDLPGDMQAVIESPIFARVDGYIAKRFSEMGDFVKAGQVMAEIETPDLDQQVQQAKATLSNSQSQLKELDANIALAQANVNLAQTTYQRWKVLQAKGAIARQDFDERDADLQVKQATLDAAKAKLASQRDTVAANEANLRRLQEMKSFAHVTAPFNGVVTYRVMDVGTLVNAGNGGANHEIFRVANIDPMRIFVNVPQAWVGAVHDGQTAELRVQELPDKVFSAKVTHLTHEVDTTSRSMLVILETPNPQRLLLPGMYAQVRFATSRPISTLLIPEDALVNGKQGTRVATVGQDGKVHFAKVRVGNDYGNEIEILEGLAPGAQVIMNPTDAVREGIEVEAQKSR